METLTEESARLREAAETTRETEAQRIAADFHDGPLQSFISIQMRLEIFRRILERDREAALPRPSRDRCSGRARIHQHETKNCAGKTLRRRRIEGRLRTTETCARSFARSHPPRHAASRRASSKASRPGASRASRRPG